MKKKLFGVGAIILTLVASIQTAKADIGKASVNGTEYPTLKEAYEAANNGETITLVEDVSLDNTIDITKNVTIDLNGKNVTNVNPAFKVDGAKLYLTGVGTIKCTKVAGQVIRVVGSNDINDTDYSYVNVGKDILIDAYAPVMVPSNNQTAYGVKIDLYNSFKAEYYAVYVNGNVKDKTNYPVINIHDGVNISSNQIGIYQAGYSEFNIDNATINAGTGIVSKAGKLNLNGTVINATGAYAEPIGNNNGSNNTGAALQIESNNGYAKNIEININGGSYSSENGNALVEYAVNDSTSINDLAITDGTFTSAPDKESVVVSDLLKERIPKFISGGTFSSPVDEFVEENVRVVQTTNGYEIASLVEETNTTETPVTTLNNPKTADMNILLSIILLIVSAIGSVYTIKKVKNY